MDEDNGELCLHGSVVDEKSQMILGRGERNCRTDGLKEGFGGVLACSTEGSRDSVESIGERSFSIKLPPILFSGTVPKKPRIYVCNEKKEEERSEKKADALELQGGDNGMLGEFAEGTDVEPAGMGKQMQEGDVQDKIPMSWGLRLCPEALQAVAGLGCKDLAEQVMEAKYGIMAFRMEQGEELWAAAAKAVNTYELVPTVASQKVINRAYYKMRELIRAFELVPSCDKSSHFCSVHLCEGPGGFIEATIDSRTSNSEAKNVRECSASACRKRKRRRATESSEGIMGGGKEEEVGDDGCGHFVREESRIQTGDSLQDEEGGQRSIRRRRVVGVSEKETSKELAGRENLDESRIPISSPPEEGGMKKYSHVWFGITMKSANSAKRVNLAGKDSLTRGGGHEVPSYLAFQEERLAGIRKRDSFKSIGTDVEAEWKVAEGESEGMEGHAKEWAHGWEGPIFQQEESCCKKSSSGNQAIGRSSGGISTAVTHTLSNVISGGPKLTGSDSLSECMCTSEGNVERGKMAVEGHVHYGEDGSGDLTKMGSIASFAEFVMAKSAGKGAFLVTGDGGFDVSEDFGTQEEQHVRLVFAQMLAALKVQAPGGSFVLKLFDCFTAATATLLAIATSLYKEVRLVRLNMTRVCSSERYMVARGYCGPRQQNGEVVPSGLTRIEDDLQAAMEDWEKKGSMRTASVGPMLEGGFPRDFMVAICGFNDRVLKGERDAIHAALNVGTEWAELLPDRRCKRQRKKAVWALLQKWMREGGKKEKAEVLCGQLGVPIC